MDPGSIQIPNGTIRGTGTSSKPPPSPMWIIIPLVVVLFMGALIAIAYRLVTRWQRRRTVAGDAEQATTGPETTVLEVGDAATGGGGLAPDSGTSQPTDRWAWVFDPSSGSGRGRHGAARMSEGLNELGEAPPPYGEDNEGPKSYVAEMVEVGDGGEGASGTAPRQGQSGAGPEPPAYELAVGPDETSSSLSLASSSIQEPPPAVMPRPR